MQMTYKVPQNWVTCTLGDVVKVQNGYAFPSKEFKGSGGIPVIRQSNLAGNRVSLEKCVYLDPIWVESKPEFILRKNDVLIGMSGSVGKLCIYDLSQPALQNQRTGKIVLRTAEVVDWRFVWEYLKTVERQLLKKGRGLGILNVSATDIESLPFPLAPLPEQRHIVAKLEKLLAKVNACRERLDKIPALLKRFRQSVLAAACSGRLTDTWREENRVDDEWSIQTLAELFTMRNGKSLTAVKRKNGDIPVYGGNGYMGTHNATNTEGQIIVIGRVGAQCGNVHYVIGKVWVTDNAISLQAKREVVPAFYAFFLCSQNLNKLSGGTGQPYVSQEILSPLEIPVVSLAEQHEIVRRVDALFKIADQMEDRYQKAKAHVEKLTQSILAKAFSGELVPQDSNDEPASELLKRIKTECAVK